MSALPGPNPYEAPIAPLAAASGGPHAEPLAPGSNTMMPRWFAAMGDIVAAFIFSVVVFKLLPDDAALLQGLAVLFVWVGYYFCSEWLLGTTPGKWVAGLTITTVDGERIGAWQAAVRTLLRIVEVNPFLLGMLPAGVCILCSRRRQRLGDLLARTVVVRRTKRS